MFGITISIIVLTVCIFLLWRGKKMTVFKELGIPGPEPNIIFGNLLEIIKKGPIKCHGDWFKKYGKVVGWYFFSIPVILVGDAEILKKIQITDFQKFANRPFSVRPPKGQKGGDFLLMLINIRDKKWKDMRKILSPTFTTSKMRGMAPTMYDAIDMLLDNIDEKVKKGESFNIYKLYQGLTMDVIGRTGFGIKANSQKDKNDSFLRTVRTMISGGVSSYLFMISTSFPSILSKSVSKIPLMLVNGGKDPNLEFFDNIRSVIKARKQQGGGKRQDLLQLMIDSKMTDEELENTKGSSLTAGSDSFENEQITENESKIPDSQKSYNHMEDEEIVDNAALFLIAGYETTSTTLAFTTHLLLHHQDVQDRLREEINSIKHEGKLDYSALSQLTYMDQVINESMRIYPAVYLFIGREASEDVDFGKFRIKKGMSIQVPSYNIHHDEDYWENPDVFDPERFSPQNKPKLNQLAFQAFGAGPRNCIGMRFALVEMKLALARILQKYKLVPSAESDKLIPKLRESPTLLAPANGVYLKAVPI